MALFNPSRDQVRRFFFDAWHKYRMQEPLTALEGMALQVMQMHPEYHSLLDAPERHVERDYFPEMGETNPFLHMSLHLSILEQVSIDQPHGIAAAYQKVVARKMAHDAQHDLMECLAETIWLSQREGHPLDHEAYLEKLKRAAGLNPE